MGNNIILETKFVADIRGSFYIPSYQRGYRWSETEVVRLLDDIYQNGKKNYCLQPVVVRKKEDRYELIDGQQRLTTLYLIYKYMKNVNPFFNEPAFTLSYQTRDQSEEFLKTLDMTKQDDNIDFWFIAKAYNTIKKWFEQDLQIRVMHIFEYLKEDVKIIWYEVGESEDAISLFTRLNIGKIPLTSAELVKAMFLSRDNAENMRREKQEEISLQWDGIERELHNESLWFFLTNSVKGEYQTRIDLVLDLIAGKDESTREKYYTFFRFDELRKEVSLDDIWKKIYQTFLTLKGWYEDHDLYHRIGYLITSGTSLHKIFALSKDKKKSEFNESLDELIKKSVAISGNYAELSYEKSLDYKRISTLLLLFNIESVRRSDGHAQRFPFDQFKHHKGSNVTWSLEHIHAQQSEGMKTQDVWKKWLELHIPSVESIGGEHSELIDEMQGAINADKLERTVFESIQQKVLGLLYFSADEEKAVANIATLEAFFDCWCKINGYDNPTEFLESFMSYTHACGKIVVDSRYKIDIFEDCLHFYSDKSGRIRQFPLNRIVLLYAITIYLQHQSEVTYSDFVRRIRIVNNLIQNSEDEVSDRQDRNRIPAILQAVDAIVLTGVIDDSIEINFNVNQIQEEKKKIEFLTQNPDCTDEVFELEDHNMLKGQIGIIGLDNLSLGSRFSSLFACSWDKIDCALMTLGNYGQQERNKWRYQFASKSLQYAWDELFHKSANAGFENTHTILVELLKSKESFDDGILDGIISAFLAQCEKDNLYPWNYYYVKYPVFRPGSYGKMSNDDVVNKPYMFSVMQTKTQWSQNTYMPYLKEADDDHLSRDEMGQYLVYDDVYIVCENNSYGVYRNDDDSLTDTVTISQNEAGIDTEDRIIKLKKYIANMK